MSGESRVKLGDPFVRARISEPFSVALMDRKDRKGNNRQPIKIN